MKGKNPALNSILYVINNLLVKAFQFFLVPIYTTQLTTQEYGVSNLVTNFTMIGGVLITLSIGSATSRYYVECKGNKKDEVSLFSSLYWFVTFFGLATSLILIFFRNGLTGCIFGEQGYVDIFVLAVVALWLSGIASQYKSVLTAVQEANTYTVVSISAFVVQLVLTIYMILVCDMGVQGILYSMIIANVLTIIYSLYDLRKKERLALQINFRMIGKALKYSLPLIPHSLSTTISQFLSRIFIGNSYSLAAVGIYGLAGQFGNIIDTVQGSVHTAYLPWFFEQKKRSENGAAHKVHRLMPIILSCYNILFLGFILFSKELIIVIAAKEYMDAWKLIPLFALNYAIKTPYYFYVSFLFYDASRVRYIFIATLSSSILNVILSAVLIPYMGMYGSTLADIVATIVQVAFVIKLCKGDNVQYFRYHHFLRSLISLIAVSAIGLLPGFMTSTSGFSAGYFLYKCAIWLMFCGFVLFRSRKLVVDMIGSVKDRLFSRGK